MPMAYLCPKAIFAKIHPKIYFPDIAPAGMALERPKNMAEKMKNKQKMGLGKFGEAYLTLKNENCKNIDFDLCCHYPNRVINIRRVII